MRLTQFAIRWPVVFAVAFLAARISQAFPPAPHHFFYGMVRNEYGEPLDTAGAEIFFTTSSGKVLRASIVKGLAPGVNYRLAVPMDSGLTDDVYQPTAMKPTVPFTVRVKIGNTLYLPIEMSGNFANLAKMGEPGKKTVLNLTLGVDSDGDGLPDAWERAIIAQSGGRKTLADIKPGDDSDGDGLTNMEEYLAGTYAFDPKDGFSVNVVSVKDGFSTLEFMAITGHSYSVVGSTNLHDWSELPFRVAGETAELQDYTADDVRVTRLEVKNEALPTGVHFFKLMVR